MIRSFDCHLVHKLQAVKQQDPVRSWRGIIMATLVIVLITGIIAISVLSVTPSELNIFMLTNSEKISRLYDVLPLAKLLNWSLQYQEVIWVSGKL